VEEVKTGAPLNDEMFGTKQKQREAKVENGAVFKPHQKSEEKQKWAIDPEGKVKRKPTACTSTALSQADKGKQKNKIRPSPSRGQQTKDERRSIAPFYAENSAAKGPNQG